MSNQSDHPVEVASPPFDAHDLHTLQQAVDRLEHPSLAARLSAVVGTPIELALHLLPRRWYRSVHETAEGAVATALRVAVAPMDANPTPPSRDWLYSLLGIASGAAGGFFGLPGLAVELPVSTGIMLRGIAEIARREGEDVQALETRLACVQVFALGGRSHADDAAETGYSGVRLALASSVSSAIEQLAHHSASAGNAPIMARLVQGVAARFGITLSQKAAAQLVPIVGAVTAATVNAIFIDHFQQMARSHFAVRRLERKYGSELVRTQYDRLAAAQVGDPFSPRQPGPSFVGLREQRVEMRLDLALDPLAPWPEQHAELDPDLDRVLADLDGATCTGARDPKYLVVPLALEFVGLAEFLAQALHLGRSTLAAQSVSADQVDVAHRTPRRRLRGTLPLEPATLRTASTRLRPCWSCAAHAAGPACLPPSPPPASWNASAGPA